MGRKGKGLQQRRWSSTGTSLTPYRGSNVEEQIHYLCDPWDLFLSLQNGISQEEVQRGCREDKMKDLIYNLASQAHLQLEAVSARSCLCNVPDHSWSMFSHGSYSLMVYVQSLSLFSVIILSLSVFSHGPYSLIVYVDSWSLFTCNLFVIYDCSVMVLIIHSWSMVLIHSSLTFSHGPYSQDIPELELESIFQSQLELHLHQKQIL